MLHPPLPFLDSIAALLHFNIGCKFGGSGRRCSRKHICVRQLDSASKFIVFEINISLLLFGFGNVEITINMQTSSVKNTMQRCWQTYRLMLGAYNFCFEHNVDDTMHRNASLVVDLKGFDQVECFGVG